MMIIFMIALAITAITLLVTAFLPDPRKIIKASYDNRTMTVTYENGNVTEFHGSGTVWHKLPMMKRCGTFEEIQLSEIYTYIRKWGNDYPDAHLKQKIDGRN
jgi:hypothetical protein